MPFDTAELFTVEEQSDFWSADRDRRELAIVSNPAFERAYVRLEPPEWVSAEAAEDVKASMLARGAAAVRVMPRRKRSVVPQAAVSKPTPQAPREAAMALVASANTKDRDALRTAVEDALAASGL